MLGGCGKNNSASPSEISKDVVSKANLTQLSPLTGDKLESYFEIKNSDVKRFSVLISSLPTSSDTVAIFEITDKEKKALVISGVSKYISALQSSMNNMETERQKISSRLLMELDNLVILIICGDTAPVEQYLKDIGATAIY
jgi:hypothetical protein